MPGRERFLLAVAVAGFVVPNAMVVLFIARHGLDLRPYFGDWVRLLPSAQLTVDLGIACAGLFGWATWERPRSGARRWWVVLPAALLVGVCFALPLFLLIRERALRGRAGVPG